MLLPRGPPAGFEKLHESNGLSWSRGIRSVIISNGCDRVLPTEDPAPLNDWLDVCAPAASADGHENPSAIVEVTPPNQFFSSTVSSPIVRRLSPEVEDVLMRLYCVSTQIIEYSRKPPPPAARFSDDDDVTDDDDDLQSAMSGDFGGATPSTGVTPSTATRVFVSHCPCLTSV